VNLVCVDAGQHFALLSEVGESFFAGHYNVGAWAWELPHFPESWYNRFAYYDEIWVGTSFIAATLSRSRPCRSCGFHRSSQPHTVLVYAAADG
jgi:hypothetical protein